jgi:IS30 family transposase
MPKTYTRLTEDERSHREIATLINKHHSTVSNEVKRNTGLQATDPGKHNAKLNKGINASLAIES